MNSPSGKLTAISFVRDCGATTDFSSQVSIIPAGQKLKNEAGNAFIAGGKIDLVLQWLSDGTLQIRGGGGHVFKQEASVAGVKVVYLP